MPVEVSWLRIAEVLDWATAEWTQRCCEASGAQLVGALEADLRQQHDIRQADSENDICHTTNLSFRYPALVEDIHVHAVCKQLTHIQSKFSHPWQPVSSKEIPKAQAKVRYILMLGFGCRRTKQCKRGVGLY